MADGVAALRVRVLGADAIRSRSDGPIACDSLDPEQREPCHLELGCALPHPWFEDQLARALGLSPTRLAQPEPRGWLARAVADFDLEQTLAELHRNSDAGDEARIELLERIREAEIDLDDWLIRALPIPPAAQRAQHERRYERVLACVAALDEEWTPAGERALARALGRLFDPAARLGDRLRLEAWAPETIAGPVVVDPDLDFEHLGLPERLAFELGVIDEDEVLIVIRDAPTVDAVLSLRVTTLMVGDRALRCSPLLLAALAERRRADASELALVVGRGRGTEALGPVHTLFARRRPGGSLLPGSVSRTLLTARLAQADEEPMAASYAIARAFEWDRDVELRRARLHAAEELLHEALDALTRRGQSLCFDDLRGPVAAVERSHAELREELDRVAEQYRDGLILGTEWAAKVSDIRSYWHERCVSSLMSACAERSTAPPVLVRAAMVSARRWVNRMFVGVDLIDTLTSVMPQNPITGIGPQQYARLAQRERVSIDGPIVAALAKPNLEAAVRMSIAIRDARPDATPHDCGLQDRGSASRCLIKEELATNPLYPPDPRPAFPAGVLVCQAPWVCARCWAEGDPGRADTPAPRAGLELARLFTGLERWWSGRFDHTEVLAHGPRRRTRRWTLEWRRTPECLQVVVRNNGGKWDPEDPTAARFIEIETNTGLWRERLPFGVSVNVQDGEVLNGSIIVATSWSGRMRLDWDTVTRIDRDNLPELPWPWTFQLDPASGWMLPHAGPDRVETTDWRVLLGGSIGPIELLSPFAGRLAITPLPDGRHELRVIETPNEHGFGRVWTERRWLNRASVWAADGDPVQAGQRLVAGQVDVSSLAAAEPESTREWLLEQVLYAGYPEHVDWRALELYARLATTPRDRYRPLRALAHDYADPLTRLRLGDALGQLRAAVLGRPGPLRDPTSRMLVDQLSASLRSAE